MTSLWRVLCLAGVTASCTGAPTDPTQPPTPLTLSLQSGAWQTISTPDPYPLSNDVQDLAFEFPAAGSMHYLFTPSPRPDIRGTVSVSLGVTTTGSVTFASLDPLMPSCSIPPSVRAFLWANENGSGPYDRWWANPRAYPLAPGTSTISIPLTPEHWSSVNGRFGNADPETKYGFAKAILNVTRLGLTFGGGCSFGHGIRVQGGSAEFRLSEYAIR